MPNTILDLTGKWKLHRAGTTERLLPATVPGCVYTDLRASGKIEDPFWGSNELGLEWIEKADWEYVRTFRAGDDLLRRERIDLVAEGLDTVATIFLNGTEIASTENMFIEYRFDVKPLLARGLNELRIVFGSPRAYVDARKKPDDYWEPNDPVGGVPQIRKMQCSFGWDWGPRLPAGGIYRPIFLEGYDGDRLEGVRVDQTHDNGRVHLSCRPSWSHGGAESYRYRSTLRLEGRAVAQVEGLSLDVPDPQLWWPNGLGAQPLYTLTVEALDGESAIDSWTRRIGLRTIDLDRHADAWGESFQFVVNGVPVFAKGANWVPAHSFVSSLGREDYDQLLSDAVSAHMNTIRVWGGGIYEHPSFYDLCDEKGLLVWQDFMFACAVYPGRPAFLDSVAAEAACQVKRLRHHACIALFCGNNELEYWAGEIMKTAERKKAYEDLFDAVIPSAIEKHAPAIPYWPSSPHNPDGWNAGPDHEGKGDIHDWRIWHRRKRATAYLEYQYRFVSEFGMQAYCSPETMRQYAPPDERNVFGPFQENHQKSPAGNGLIFEYISQRYPFPRDLDALVYLSQVNQAYCVQTGVEHHRRSMPRTMGSLYWQLNDCWPVASWSGIEFGGRWRALHYAARRFFAPAAVSVKLVGDEEVGRINRQINTIEGAEVHTVYDGPGQFAGKVGWILFHVDGRALSRGSRPVTLEHGQSLMVDRLTFAGEFAKHGKASLCLYVFLENESGVISRSTGLFTSPRLMSLPREKLTPKITKTGDRTFKLTFRTKTFQAQVYCNLPNCEYRASDNYFDLHPRIVHEVIIETKKPMDVGSFRKRLETMAIADSA